MKRTFLFLGLVIAAFAVFANVPVQTRVSFTSQPAGATVVIDGIDRGTTPITLFDLAPGRHHVKYRLAGYVEVDRFFRTEEGPFIEKSEVLSEEKGLLLLKSEPTGANILVDGVSVGQTPRLVTTLSAKDQHSVVFRKAGYLDQKITVRFDGRKPQIRSETLVLASGTIEVQSDPAGAEVTVNGIVRGKTPITVADVPKGRATVKLTMDGFEDEVIPDLSVNAGDCQTVSRILRGKPGTLHLVSVPEGARFYVNGESHGKGPVTLTGLKPGSYDVRVELDGFGTESRTLSIANGESVREEFKLSNVMGRLEVRTSPVGAQLILDGRPVGITKSVDPAAETSDVFAIENLLTGEHTLVVRKDGFAETVRHPKIKSSKTSQWNVRLKRIYLPDTEILTARGSYRGVLVSINPDTVILEVKPGINQSFPRDEIRRMESIKATK